ncbi:hypothetical protein GTA08_BOTSDO05167 [Neofusicoccum parvum]|uniref:Uncharacterized protein n=1 Tax=Neofusicoccum parvum TaxID=310453 RepID=A0ACB5RSA0_9PEZI|nr:hypothetical protein GTA08_BOTSDO05167 [Neofusicoccum parvum]
MQKDYQNEVVVAQLSGVSKNLSEEDIKRLVPTSSKYIEGWSDPDFIKVIPVRDEQTLERLDRYFILFRTVRAARNFQEHVKKLHTIVKSYAPSSLNSPLPPPPGFHDDSGRDINAAMQSYTIGPPSSNFIYCSIIPTPYPRPIRQLLTAGGYEPIISTSTAAASVTKVLLHFEGAQPSLADIRRTISRDGKDRWLPWQIVGGTNSADGIVRLTTHLSRDEAVGNDIDALVVRKVPPRYVISFEDKAEAQRFVRRWNRTSFGWSVNDVYENGEGAPQARAEVLW